MRTVIEHNYSYFKIYRMWGHSGAQWRWDMDDDQLADAAFYKGVLRMEDAFDKSIIGTAFRGFFDFRRASPHLSRFREYQICVNDVDTEWFCLHGEGCELRTSFLQLMDCSYLPPDTSLVVLEGSARARLQDREVLVGPMQHLKPRDYVVPFEGDAKVFFIRKAPPPARREAQHTV